jgi:hypothetical protein
VSKIPSKKRRKELREEYNKIQGKKYVEEIKKYPHISSFEWVEYKTSLKKN